MPAKAPDITTLTRLRLEALGGRLRARRKALGLTAVVVAEAAGISRVTLHRIERGEPSVTAGAWMSVADALGWTVDLVEADAEAGTAASGDTIPVSIRLADYPVLAGLAWQTSSATTLTPAEALAIYERNWRHVDEEALSDEERVFIDNLRAALARHQDV